MTSVFALAAAVFGSFFRGKRELVLENLALRQQLAVYKRVQERPRLRSTDRAFWVWLSKLWDGWKTPLILVRPEAGDRVAATQSQALHQLCWFATARP